MGASGVLTGEAFAEMLAQAAHRLPVNVENAKIWLMHKTLQQFKDNFANERFYDRNHRWAPISEKWRARKRKRGFSTDILKERGNLVRSIKATKKSKGFKIYCDPSCFTGPDKRHTRMYAEIHNAGLPGSGSPKWKRVKRQFIGYAPGDEAMKIEKDFSLRVMFGLPGGSRIA